MQHTASSPRFRESYRARAPKKVARTLYLPPNTLYLSFAQQNELPLPHFQVPTHRNAADVTL